ncbi:MAG: glycosyltransferase family 2 protein [Proteobacteria bacterium]|nr:glycosyltransferase family 2 protein [Pseudomonadota bacterium]
MNQVAILMTTYNGEKFLREQLLSIEKQTYSHWHLFVFDDGSSDNTLSILKDFQERIGLSKVTIQQKNHLGCAKNFLSLVCETTGDYDFYSYADQDDIWDTDKLERAIIALKTLDLTLPALYCSSSRLINAEGNLIGKSPICKRPPSFQNALVQNIAAGNTMVFNKPARSLLMKIGVIDISIHDWWTYIVVTACGGSVYYDELPSLSYRQHANNLIGLDTSIKAFLKSMLRTWEGKFRTWNEAHIRYLEDFSDFTSSQSKMTLAYFKKSRHSGLYQRIRLLQKAGVFRQHPLETAKLYLACVFNKV